MKRFHQVFLFLQMAILSVVIMTTLAPVEAEQIDQTNENHCAQCEMNVRKEFRVHLDFYYELLAEKYAPTEVKRWHDIRNERDLLRKKLNEAKKKGDLEHAHSLDQTWLEEHKRLQESFHIAVEKRDADTIKALLPQVFDHYHALNQLYKERLHLNVDSKGETENQE